MMADRETNLWKEIALGAVASGCNGVSFWLWSGKMPLIAAGGFQSYGQFIGPTATLVMGASLLALVAILVKTKWVGYATGALAIVIPFFFLRASNVLGIVAVATILLSIFAVYRMRKEYLLSLGFSVSKVLKAGVPLYFTLVSVMVALFYAGALDEEKAISALLPRSVFTVAMNFFSSPLQSLSGLSSLRPEATIDEVLGDLVKQQSESQGVEISEVPKGEFARAVDAQREELAKQYGITLSGDERLMDVLYAAITDRFEELLGPYKTYLPIAAAVAFFFAFKALTFPLYFLTILVIFLLMKIMRAATIVKVETQTIKVEKLTL